MLLSITLKQWTGAVESFAGSRAAERDSPLEKLSHLLTHALKRKEGG